MTTTQEMRALEKDAFAALQEAIDNGGRIRMRIPASPERDTDLRITAALRALLDAADQLEAVQNRERIDRAVGAVLFNASNYPRSAMPHMLGQDIEPLRAKVTDAVLAIITTDTADATPTTPPIPVGLCGASGCVFKAGHESEHSWGGAS